jgi:hypothetical protein
MATMKPFIKSYIMIEQTPGDVDEDFPIIGSLILGILHVFCGLFSIALGIGSICTHATGYFIGYGIWCGFIFLLSGVCVMFTCCRRCAKSVMILLNLVFGVIAACAAAVQFSIGVAAASNDNGNLIAGRLTAAGTTSIPHYDIFHIFQMESQSCVGSGFTWISSWGAVDILLLIVAFIEAVVAITTAAFGCRSICCGRVLALQELSNTNQQGTLPPYSRDLTVFHNEGYDPAVPPEYMTRQ